MTLKPQVLFIHTNYPAQFRYLVKAYLSKGWDVWFASHTQKHPPLPEINIIQLEKPNVKKSKLESQQHTSLLTFEALLSAKRHQGLNPILTYVHTGWSLGQFTKDLFPKTIMIAYSEWWFNLNSSDFHYDPDNIYIHHTQKSRLEMTLRNQAYALELQQADSIVSPTEWQKKQLPKLFRERCSVIFDGIDSGMFSPLSPTSQIESPFSDIPPDKPLLTYATRGLEPYRGFPEFAEAIKVLLRNQPDWHIAIAGQDKVNYYHGSNYPKRGYASQIFKQLEKDGFGSRVHLLGPLSLKKYRDLLRRSDLHCYFTRPYVLSWSLIESALTGCRLFCSNTEPVLEFLENDLGSLLTDHTSPDLGETLLNYASTAVNNQRESSLSRRSDRNMLVQNVNHQSCVAKHYSLAKRLLK
tara:strand:+ start:30 stop:1259 length:1230 start_codon:yes stop_codon:yes gene_type:complete